MASEPVRRSKRGMVHEDHEEELSIKIPRLDELGDEEDKKSRASMSPALGMAIATTRRDSRVGQGQDKPAELFRKDLISAMKLADTEQLQPDDYVLISDSWKQEWEHGVQVPVNPTETIQRSINIQKIAGNENLHGSYAFKLPKKFLHAMQDENFKQGIHELHETQKLADQVCRYDLDDLDVAWLNKINEEREAMGQEPVAEWVMEKVVEELESQCYNNMQNMIKTVEGLGIEYDENVVCDVCRSPEGEDNNEIVFCDGCDICVHQACYGIQKIPEGSWLCRTCALGIKPQCILCPKTGGAMKSTKSGTKWSHVSCALWIPEVSIGCPEKMEPITKISQIPSSRWSLICNICRERSGACIQCSVKTCKTAFHVTCAFNNNLNMKTLLDEDHDDVQLKAFCGKHSNIKKKEGDQTPATPKKEPSTPKRELILLRDPDTPSKKESEMTEEEKTKLRSHRLAKLAEEFYACVEVTEVAEACRMDEETIDFFYNYWVLKRKSNFNKPLLTPKTEEADLLLKQREDSLVARMKMFIHLRQDLERVRNLCYMVSRREKIRRQLYTMKEDVFRQQVQLLNTLGSQSHTRDYHHIIRAHRQSDTLYDCYDAILHTASAQDQRHRQEDATVTETDSDNDSSIATSSKLKVKRPRDSKRRLAFAKAAKAKKIKASIPPAEGREPGEKNVQSCGGVSRLEEEHGDGDSGLDPAKSEAEGSTGSPRVSLPPGRGRGRRPVSFWQKKRSRRSLMRMAVSSKTSDPGEGSGVLDTSVSEAETSVIEEPVTNSKAQEKTPKVRSRRSLRKKTSLVTSEEGNEAVFCSDDKVTDESRISESLTKDNTAEGVKEDIKKMDDRAVPDEVPKEEINTPEKLANVPSESKHVDIKAQSLSEPRSSRNSKRTRKVSESAVLGCSSQLTSDVLKCDNATEKSKLHNDPEETKRTNCDTEDEGVNDGGRCDGSVDNSSTHNPKLTRKRAALERTISSDSIPPKLGGNGTALPQVEVSVDETSGKISLRVRNHSVVDKQPDKTTGTASSMENGEPEKMPPQRHSFSSVELETGPSSPGKNRLRLQRRSSSRLQTLGINGLVSPSQLIVRQEIKDKVHSHLGRHRSARQLNNHRQINGIVQSDMDNFLTAKRRKSSPSKIDVDVTRDILEGALTKENHPNNGPLLSKYPVSIDLMDKGLDKNNKASLKSPKSEVSPPGSRKSSVFGDLDTDKSDLLRRRNKRSPEPDAEDLMTTPAMSTRSSRATTPEGFTLFGGRRSSISRHRDTPPSVINISDSEDSLNLLVQSDSEYAPSEDSENSGPVKRLRSRSNRVVTVDEASRDSATSSVRSSARLNRSLSKVSS